MFTEYWSLILMLHFRNFRPGISQGNSAIEHQFISRRIRIDTKVTKSFELKSLSLFDIR